MKLPTPSIFTGSCTLKQELTQFIIIRSVPYALTLNFHIRYAVASMIYCEKPVNFNEINVFKGHRFIYGGMFTSSEVW
jgi:hypothetical protein